ncbi:MAG: OmpA family protein [Terracidiphilus sp.]
MKNSPTVFLSIPRQLALIALASAITIPGWAQDQVSTGISAQNTPQAAAQDQALPAVQPMAPAREGFWGRINPFARKSWVKKQTDPINDRLSELDELNARNARDIKDVDARAQAGIRRAQTSAEAANQLAMAANTNAQNASTAAQRASSHVSQLNGTVSGLDQYRQVTDVEIAFRNGSPALTTNAKDQLDALASKLAGREGYILEMEAHSPAAGSSGIQNSERLAEAIKRYLVTEHQIPVYRMHSVALGNEANASGTGTEDQKPERVRTSSVHVRLMENSLAARADSSPQSVSVAAGAEQP